MQVTRPALHSFVLMVLSMLAAYSVSNTAHAAAVTMRLSTGLPPSGSAGVLPQTWVAPAGQAPQIDGKLDEEAWDSARAVVLGKLQTRGKTSPRTEARLLHKDKVLYVGIVLGEPNLGKLKRTVAEDDGPLYQDDSVELFISPDPSQGYYQFILGASGAVFDRKGYGDP